MRLNLKQVENNFLNQNGITLIVLVVTIVILLILAGVSISALFGDSGIIDRAKEAQNKMDSATGNDKKEVSELGNWLENKINNSDKSEGIEFTIGTQKYKMEKDMTWKEWIESSYNVDKYKIDGNETNGIVLREDSIDTIKYCITKDQKVLAKDNIVSGQTYTITTIKLPTYWYLSKEGEYISTTSEDTIDTALSNGAQLAHCSAATYKSQSEYNSDHKGAGMSVHGQIPELSIIESPLTTNEKLIITRQINKNVYKHGEAIEKTNDLNQITTIQELLQQMNVNTNEQMTTNKGNKIDINQYELMNNLEEIYLTNTENDRRYNINGSVKLNISSESIKDMAQEDILLVYINANTEKDEIYIIEPNEFDSSTGTMTIELSNLGVIGILDKIE